MRKIEVEAAMFKFWQTEHPGLRMDSVPGMQRAHPCLRRRGRKQVLLWCCDHHVPLSDAHQVV